MPAPRPPAALLLALLLAAPASAAVVHVKADAAGAGTGGSWADAFPSLAAAIAASRSGDQLWIAAGTYRPGVQRSDSFTPKPGTALYGGFRGGETALAQRSGDPALTVLSGDIGALGVAGDNAYCVLSLPAPGSYLMAGLTITGGYADGLSNLGTDRGGGVRAMSPAYTFEAIAATFEDCRIAGNRALLGSACFAIAHSGHDFVLRRCQVVDNHPVAGTSGPAPYLYLLATAVIEDSVFAGNSQNHATAASGNYGAFLGCRRLANSLFVDNDASGVYASVTSNRDPSTVSITSCTFAGNRRFDLELIAPAGTTVAGCIAGVAAGDPPPGCWIAARDGDPRFAAAGSASGADGLWFTADDGYRLAAGSPCIDIPGLIGLPATDISGLARPQGRGFDHGAYERDQGGQAPAAASFTATGQEDADLAIAIAGSDADSAALTGRILSLPARGALHPTLDGASASGPALTAADLPFRLPDPGRRVLYRPPPDANGAAIAGFTADLDDGAHTSWPAAIAIDLAAVNDAPTIAPPAAVALGEDFAATTIVLAGIGSGDPEGGQTLTVSARSSDPAILPHPLLLYASPGATASLTLTAAPDAAGAATVSITVSDGGGTALGGRDATTVELPVAIAAANDPPSFAFAPASGVGADLAIAIDEDAPWTVLGLDRLAAGPANEAGQALALLATTLDPSLLEVEAGAIDRAGGTASLRLRPRPDRSGSTQLVATLIDDGPNTPGGNAYVLTLAVSVRPANDPPLLARNAGLTVPRGGSAAFSSAILALADPDLPAGATLVFTLLTAPLQGALELDGVELAAGSGFSQQDVDDGRVAYRHRGGEPVGDTAAVSFTDGLIAAPYPTASLLFAIAGKALPVVALPASAAAWQEDGPPLAFAATATVADADDAAMPAGRVTASLAAGDGGDLLAIAHQGVGAGQIGRDGASVLYGGRAIGSWRGGGAGAALVVDLAGPEATLEAVQALVRAFTYAYDGDPAAAMRTVTVVVDDGTSGASPPASTAFAVVPRDDPPAIASTRLAIPAGARYELTLAASDPDSPVLTWSLLAAPARVACTLVDAASGRISLAAPADARGADALAVAVSDGVNPATSATLAIAITGPDDPRPLPAGEFPGEAWAGESLRADIPFDCRQIPGARLAFLPGPAAPPGLVLTADGTTLRASWPVPAGEPAGHRLFTVLAIDLAGGSSAVLPVAIPLRALPRGSN